MNDVLPFPRSGDKKEQAAHELELVSRFFHQVNRVLPEQQQLVILAPETLARDAISMLRKHSYSQAPVAVQGNVLGVFSFRSFARKAAESSLAELKGQQIAPGDLPVEECLEEFEYARVSSEWQGLFDAMERDNGVLVGSPEQLQGILTPMDFLRYLYKVANPYVMISEIELTLRALFRLVLSPQELEEFAERSLLSASGKPEKVPKTLETMTFDNYRQLIANKENWPKFEPVLGGNRQRVSAKLQQIVELRNVLFHFKRDITLEDHETLSEHRRWLWLQAKKVELANRGGHPE